ncbi:protein DCL, chloroplastic-like [Diospyros lotus]|uniref:protein DCL, chloroplastic-like n=1 Tax=Diospyros lotus TaxID=55363 RepID=UPI00225210EA|nr:protein DCL, chloroplastic-like [Diospyros lotus]
MASSSSSPVYPRLPHIHFCSRKPLSLYFLSVPSSILSFPSYRSQFRNWALKTRSTGDSRDANATTDLLRKPLVKESVKGRSGVFYEDEDDESGGKGEGEGWVDWEDQILEDTVPLVGFVRMILHSGKELYMIGTLVCIIWNVQLLYHCRM